MLRKVCIAGATGVLLSARAFAVADGCAVVLTTPDGYLSLRAGPGTNHKQIMRIPSGQLIGIDDLEGDTKRDWMHVTGLMKKMPNGSLEFTTNVEGWVYAGYVHGIACD